MSEVLGKGPQHDVILDAEKKLVLRDVLREWMKLKDGVRKDFRVFVSSRNSETDGNFENAQSITLKVEGGKDAILSYGEEKLLLHEMDFSEEKMSRHARRLLKLTENPQTLTLSFKRIETAPEQEPVTADGNSSGVFDNLSERFQGLRSSEDTAVVAELRAKLTKMENAVLVARDKAEAMKSIADRNIREANTLRGQLDGNQNIATAAAARAERFEVLNVELKAHIQRLNKEVRHLKNELETAQRALLAARSHEVGGKKIKNMRGEPDELGVRRFIELGPEYRELSKLYTNDASSLDPSLPGDYVEGLEAARSGLRDVFDAIRAPGVVKIPGYQIEVTDGPLRGVLPNASQEDIDREMKATVKALSITLNLDVRQKETGSERVAVLEGAQLLEHILNLKDRSSSSDLRDILRDQDVKRVRFLMVKTDTEKEKQILIVDIPVIQKREIKSLLKKAGLYIVEKPSK